MSMTQGIADTQVTDPTLAWRPPTNDEQKTIPWRTVAALAIGVMLWLGSYLGLVGVLVPAKIAEIAPESKTSVVALMSAVAMIVSTIANIVEGALSDRTRSRWGRRTPWIVFGSVGTFVMVLLWGNATTVWQIVLCDAVYMIFLNAIVAPLIAVIADKSSPRLRGTISSIYALGYSAGLYGGQIVAAWFLPVPQTGFLVMAILSLLSGPVAALLLKEKSTKNMPVEPITWATFSDNFAFPTKGARNYYYALVGKLLIITATFAVSGYQLYILTDYAMLSEAEVQRYVSLISLIMMITAILTSLISGPLADKFKVRKLPVVISSAMVAVGVLVPFFSPNPQLLLVYALVAGLGMGMFNAVDQALNIEILPNQKTAAKDLGILNMANNGGQVFGPVFASLVIGFAGYAGIFPLAAILALLGMVAISMIRGVK